MNIYQENILDHYKRSPYRGSLVNATKTIDQQNPLCGDHIELQLKISGDIIQTYRFSGEGCAISIAAASMLGGLVEGKTLAGLQEIRDDDLLAELGVPLSPTRTKCGLLALAGLRRMISER